MKSNKTQIYCEPRFPPNTVVNRGLMSKGTDKHDLQPTAVFFVLSSKWHLKFFPLALQVSWCLPHRRSTGWGLGHGWKKPDCWVLAVPEKLQLLTEIFSLLESCIFFRCLQMKWKQPKFSVFNICMWFCRIFLLVVVLYKPKFYPNTTINYVNSIDNNISINFDYILK